MLVLTRKAGQSFCIGESIVITVQSIKGEHVRIAIEAPKEIPILREELRDARQINKEALLPERSAIDALREKLKK
jgi:carbon storage regulator